LEGEWVFEEMEKLKDYVARVVYLVKWLLLMVSKSVDFGFRLPQLASPVKGYHNLKAVNMTLQSIYLQAKKDIE
jgi:hypothetical protein